MIILSFGDILRELISDRRISQKQLAEYLNINASTLGNYIQDTREPNFEMLKKLADFFNVTTDYLLDHRTGYALSHKEDKLLRIFRALTTDQQDLFIEQGKLFVKHNNHLR